MIPQNEPPKLFYRGSSMKGTFKPGDRLAIEAIPFSRIRKGDLIVFRRKIKGKTEFVVHRVGDVTPDGLLTRADNSRFNDQGMVTKEIITGRVVSVDRNGTAFPPRNGIPGRLHALRLHTRLRILHFLKRFLRVPYRFLKKSRIVAKIWHPKIKIAHFQTPEGPVIKYVHGERVVATYWTEQKKWLCQSPYNLVLPPPPQFSTRDPLQKN